MTATTTLSNVRRTAARVRETLAEINYAQRRMTEIRMGLPLVEPVRRPGIATTTAQLEALYDEDPIDEDPTDQDSTEH
jgi:hypothetical protein